MGGGESGPEVGGGWKETSRPPPNFQKPPSPNTSGVSSPQGLADIKGPTNTVFCLLSIFSSLLRNSSMKIFDFQKPSLLKAELVPIPSPLV